MTLKKWQQVFWPNEQEGSILAIAWEIWVHTEAKKMVVVSWTRKSIHGIQGTREESEQDNRTSDKDNDNNDNNNYNEDFEGSENIMDDESDHEEGDNKSAYLEEEEEEKVVVPSSRGRSTDDVSQGRTTIRTATTMQVWEKKRKQSGKGQN